MGSLCRMRAANRLRTALEQQIDDREDREEMKELIWQLTHWVEQTTDSAAINDMAEEFANDPDEIDWPQ